LTRSNDRERNLSSRSHQKLRRKFKTRARNFEWRE